MVTQQDPHQRGFFKPQEICITEILQGLYYIGKQQDKQRCRQHRPLPEASYQAVEPDYDEVVSAKGANDGVVHPGSDKDLYKKEEQGKEEIWAAESEHNLKSTFNCKVKDKN
jgi:hypothetical protein